MRNGRLLAVSEKYALPPVPLVEIDARDIPGEYDLIVMKSVLGGLCRDDDYGALAAAVGGIAGHLTRGGSIITLDNGHVGAVDRLRKRFGAGRNRWTYFRPEAFVAALAGYEVRMAAFGCLNFGSARLLARSEPTGLEVVNDALHVLDRLLCRVLPQGAVLSSLLKPRHPASAPERPAR
ncbi:hypothetical protein [Arenibaculum pallidiluteum]|uniref:hypothetical protein n=1 Tax=Arenibaculum pallidiluteum TaxID=2812559 RepID=UPI001A956BFB|nr:hypothetical protein [Arenibaculum pallidiluteum]